MVGKTSENSSAFACMLQPYSTALTLLAIHLLRTINPQKAKKNNDDKECAITKRQPEINCCALGLVNYGPSGTQPLPQAEKVPERIYHYL